MSEPEIHVNGVLLTQAQTMALRVAVTTVAFEMRQPGSLGNDPIGRDMSKAYADRLDEVFALMFKIGAAPVKALNIKDILIGSVVHDALDRVTGITGSWETAPLVYDAMTEKDIGRIVIYKDYERLEVGRITSFKNDTVFARYHQGDTAAATSPEDLVFGVKFIGEE